MSAPVIDEIALPGFISRGAQGGPGFRTVVVGTAGGQEQRVQQWADPRAEWTISLDQRDTAGFTTLLAFWYARAGRARGFRFKDWSDYQATNEPLYPTGQSASNPVKGAPTAQLVRTYSDAAGSYTRNIYKPVSSPAVTLRKNAVSLSFTSVDTTTGLVSLTSQISKSITAVTLGNPTVVTVGAAHGFVTNDLVYFSGIVGTVGLNGLVGTVTGTGASTINVGIDSTLMGAWVSGGTAAKYLATTDSIDATFQFDLPVRFDQDLSNFTLQDVAIRDMSQVRIIELKG